MPHSYPPAPHVGPVRRFKCISGLLGLLLALLPLLALGQAPTLTAVSPWIGGPGSVLTLTGTNLAGTTTITFAGSAGTKTVSTGFTATATGIAGVVVPAGAQSGPLTVTTGIGTSAVVNTVFFSRANTLATGSFHTVAVRADGTLWAWGDNGDGQLGNNSTTNSAVPVRVGTATTWVSAAAGA